MSGDRNYGEMLAWLQATLSHDDPTVCELIRATYEPSLVRAAMERRIEVDGEDEFVVVKDLAVQFVPIGRRIVQAMTIIDAQLIVAELPRKESDA